MSDKLIYVLNGNGSAELTAKLADVASSYEEPGIKLEFDTANESPCYIANRSDVVHAASAILDKVEGRLARNDTLRPDAILLACFGEPGLSALRESLNIPVIGMLEASVATAVQLGRRFSILTPGADWPDQLADLLNTYGFSSRCAGIDVLSNTSQSDETSLWPTAMQADIERILKRDKSQVVIVGGATTAGRPARLNLSNKVQVIDAFYAAFIQACALTKLKYAN